VVKNIMRWSKTDRQTDRQTEKQKESDDIAINISRIKFEVCRNVYQQNEIVLGVNPFSTFRRILEISVMIS